MKWDELDRPIKYVIHSQIYNYILPVKVYSMAPNWNGATKARTLTLFKHDTECKIDYDYKDIFETIKDARLEVFKRKLKGKA